MAGGRRLWLATVATVAVAVMLEQHAEAADCYDKPGWRSPQNVLSTCAWFAAPPRNDEYSKCTIFTREFDKFDGHTASSACCACGGGCRPADLVANDTACDVTWVYTGSV
eukprot:331768-Hanusia_phi.AAC.12